MSYRERDFAKWAGANCGADDKLEHEHFSLLEGEIRQQGKY